MCNLGREKGAHMKNDVMKPVINEVKEVLEKARSNVAITVNRELLVSYWKIGEIIVRYEQNEQIRAAYGTKTLKQLARELSKEFGKGFSVSNLQFMRRFYSEYSIQQTASVKLSWSHYCELLSISDNNKRTFYEKEAINSNWSVRELKRQISTSLYERVLLSKGEMNKQEADLQRALVNQIEKFLLELGRGFMFVGVQQRITINNTHYYADMVFYNKPLKAYVIVELKTSKLLPEAVGQLNMYLNYYENEVNDEDDNKPIGIILCTDKDAVAAEYALGGLSNNIFASKYTYYIPDKERLIAEVEKVINRK